MATVLVLAALLVAVVGGGAWWWTHRGDGLPDHLGPYARSTDPAITSAMDLARDQARRQAGAVGDYSIDAAAYGTSAQGAFLFRLTGPGVAGAFGDQLAGLPGIQRVGADRCMAMGPASMCVRVEGDRALMVVTADGTHGSAGASGGVGAVLTASWTDQAWAAMQ